MFHPPVFEPEKVDPALLSDPQIAYKILSGFVEILREELLKAKNCLLVHDFNGFAFSMHKIKPNFMYLHLETGYLLARELDSMATNQPVIRPIQKRFKEFHKYCEAVLPQIEAHLFTLQHS